ncbi:MAG: 3-methyl-2-oxobutanoate dehydrogenase subunit VorB [Dehalococcoidia bacterium]|nr:3-methyl-2-oxobutanoate dehydrogenase subunit VorB [Dehalococcoidia bacterium]
MGERMFIEGNVAIGWGAAKADCQAFFGYPITPQNEITEWFAREFPKMGRIFVQSQSELGSINILYGAAAAGVRAMTSTSSPGWSLMQETVSDMANAELPCVIVHVQRAGPGGGPIRHAQQDYLQCTRGGGHGDYRNIVLAPASSQECCDLVQLAFYLADKYRNPVIVMSDAIIGRLRETVEVKKIEFGPVPDKEWAARGKGRHKDGKRRVVDHCADLFGRDPNYRTFLQRLDQKVGQMQESELQYESYKTDDAELILVAYGYTARVSKEAVNMARAEGIRAGLIRPIAIWPFPYKVIGDKARQGCKFLVVEDCLGQMVEDVRFAVEGCADVHLVSILDRHIPTDGGMILPDKVFDKIRQIK